MSTRGERSAAFRRGLGLDYSFVAQWVGMHERVCSCEVKGEHWTGACQNCSGRLPDVEMYDLGQLAHLLGVGESKVAITMKYAVKEGLANLHRDLPRGQAAWTPTEKANEMFPTDRAHIMPEHDPIEMESGTFQPMSPADVRAQTPGKALEGGRTQRELTDGDEDS